MKTKILSALLLSVLLTNPSLAMEEKDEIRNPPSYAQKFPGIQQTSEGLYLGKIPQKNLWLVMEQVDHKNLALWRQYIRVQSGSCAVDFASKYCKGSTGNGALHFKAVLEEISPIENEIWVAYITSAATPQKSQSDADA